jgi:hypothetical protein
MAATVRGVALWSGIACAVLATAFTGLMLLDVLHVYGGTLQLVPVLVLAPVYLVLVSTVHHAAPAEKRIWSLLGLVLSVPYAVLVSFNYLMQLTVVRQNPALYPWLAMAFRPDSMFGAIELLGYGWQSLALLALIPVFDGCPALKTLLGLNAALALAGFVVDVAMANPLHPVTLISFAVWCLAFPISMVMMGLWVRRVSG